MNVSFPNLTKKSACWLLILFVISSIQVFGQKELSGNLNQPFAHVTSIFDADEVDVDDASQFAPGDTILLIQMQGVGVLTATGVFGNYQTSFGTPGGHEFIIIESIIFDIISDRIKFKNNIRNTYDTKGNIQIVRVPYYNSAVVTNKLFCDPWDPVTGKGGVLALILGRTLKLDADIDLTGQGLRGAPITYGDGEVRYVAGTNGSSYPLSFTNAGIKGEGLALHDEFGFALFPDHAKGEGKNYTGGGGGNGKFSGGGGGSHIGNGGTGGYEADPGNHLGGFGGVSVGGSLIGRIFMGGGGGSSTSMSGPGGNGGGIVIIVTDSIIGNGHKILVNGANGGDAVATGGAGGGGAAGTIALSLTSFGPVGSALNLHAEGGEGGKNSVSFGEGGGGGGGLIYLSKETDANVTIQLDGGESWDPVETGYGGGTGEKKTDFKAVLNGFLFNSIRSSVTGNEIDSVCSNQLPPKITGTTPVGGTAPYTYKWQKSYDKTSWFTILEDNSSINYSPAAETSTVYYRRIVSDVSLLEDVSKEVMIIVQPFIKNNTIGSDQIICYNQDPVALISTGTLADGNGKYTFRWETSSDNLTYTQAANTYNTQGYDPPALTADAWYRRTVISGRCVDTSVPVSVTVLDTISKNRILNLPPDICNGMVFENLTGSTPSTTLATLAGGDNTFRFKWQSNINGSGWIDAPGINNTADYNPGELAERAPMNEYFFRRVVSSGAGDVCVNISNIVRMRDFPVIRNNIISSPQTICSGTAPVMLVSSVIAELSGGNGVFSYTWQDSSKAHTWTDIAGQINSASGDFQPPFLTDTTRYRRIVYSSACSDVSKSIRIDVHKPITNYSISTLSHTQDTTICHNQDPNRLEGELPNGGTNLSGSYTYQWLSSTNNFDFIPVAGSGTGIGYDPVSLGSSTWYKRETKSGACVVISTPVKITVLPVISNNTLSQSQTICFDSQPAPISSPAPDGGSGVYLFKWQESFDGGLTWADAAGTNNTEDYTFPAPLAIPGKFRRIVTSGVNNQCCSDTSDIVDISLFPPLPSALIMNSDTTIYSRTPVLLKLKLTGTGPWDVTWMENSRPGSERISSGLPEISIFPQEEEGVDIFTYVLKEVKDANGCLARDISGKLLVHMFPGFEIPEGFSPNGDGMNDKFVIKGLNPQVPENQVVDLRIVTSAGSEVFHTTNSGGNEWQDWDGTDSSGKDLAEGTYYYLLNVRTVLNNLTYKLSGFIILKRY